MMRAALITVAMAWLAVTDSASAHAFLKTAVPPVGGTVTAAPTEVVINYTEGVEPDFCTVTVQGASGARVDKGEVHLAPNDDQRLIVPLQPLRPGTYKVIWHATAVDTHKTQGSFIFTVAP